MVDVTFLEVHLDGAEFTANAPGSGRLRSGGDESGGLSFGGDGDESGLGSGDSRRDGGVNPLPALLAFVGLVVVAVVVRRILGGSGEPIADA